MKSIVLIDKLNSRALLFNRKSLDCCDLFFLMINCQISTSVCISTACTVVISYYCCIQTTFQNQSVIGKLETYSCLSVSAICHISYSALYMHHNTTSQMTTHVMYLAATTLNMIVVHRRQCERKSQKRMMYISLLQIVNGTVEVDSAQCSWLQYGRLLKYSE